MRLVKPHPPHPRDAAVRGRQAQLRAAERWARRHLGGIEHELRVADVARTVFGLTADLHELDHGSDGHLLRLASLVHDVGRSIDDDDHPSLGAGMILADTTLPLSPAERRALAFLTLYHRGDVPAGGDDDVLHPEDDHAALRTLLALLRCADALDSRSLESPRLVFALRGGPPRPRLDVTCYVQTDSAKVRRTYRRRKKFHLLEEVLGCRVRVEVALAHSLRLVA